MTTISNNFTGALTSDANVKNISRAISAFADEARVDSSLLLSTALVSSDARITDSGEGYTGVIRFLNYTDPANEQPNQTAAANISTFATASHEVETYVKNIGVVAAQEASIQSLISKVDGLGYLGSKFGAIRARKEENNLRSVLSGVANKVYGTAPTADAVEGTVNTFGFSTAYTVATKSYAKLFALTTGGLTARNNFFDTLLNAMTAVSGEFEESFYYLAVNAETFNVLRKENILDGALVTDGNITFSTLLGGKIRLVITGTKVSRGVQLDSLSAVTNLPTSTLTGTTNTVSYLMKAGSFAYSTIAQNNPTAIDNNPLAYNGGGAITIVSRWGNIIHPMGYSWNKNLGVYPTDANLSAGANWDVVASNVNQTGIFPIFHG